MRMDYCTHYNLGIYVVVKNVKMKVRNMMGNIGQTEVANATMFGVFVI